MAEELQSTFTGRKIRYVCSEELTGNEVAAILGAAIGKPELQWVAVTDEEVLDSLTGFGMNPKIAAGLVEMYASLHTGLLAEDYFRNRPILGRTKMTDFAKEFAAVYHQK
ncbi:Rossmann-fold NAD(P)-binding domain-containing protein [Mucilaginibacter humi]|uniref:hypothetical protein n=1 Tax=Mucilaginibacter humi TaxID=2732510 RepID=UPI001FE54876|nr:hypothetical protein [Mucilaginibacter humi]